MKTKSLIAIYVCAAFTFTDAFAQSSVEEIEAQIEKDRLANIEAEKAEPTMEFDVDRTPSGLEDALNTTLEMRRVAENFRALQRTLNELSEHPELIAIQLNPNLTSDEKFKQMVDVTAQKIKKREKKIADAAKKAADNKAAADARAALANAPRAPRPPVVATAPKPVVPEVKPDEPISVSFVHEFNDGSPTKVGFIQGVKLGFSGVVGGKVNKQLNGKTYTIKSVDQIGDSDRYRGQAVYNVVLTEENGRTLTLVHE